MPDAIRPKPTLVEDQVVVLTLQAAALLCSPTDADGSGVADVWSALSGSSLACIRHFARQSLVGSYLGRRAGGADGYRAYLLTSPGSVFVLKVVDPAVAADRLHRWLERGLDIPAWACDLGLNDWRRSPFQPANGYGEVALDLTCHRSWKPNSVDFVEIAR